MRLFNADCLDVLPTLPDNSVDMVMADPPYATTQCSWDSIIPLEPLWKELKRVTKKRGAIVMTASQPFTSALVMSNLEMFKYCWVWDKVKTGNPLNAKKCPLPRTEDICIFYSKPPIYNPLMEAREKTVSSGKVNKKNIKCFKGLDGESRTYTHKYPTNVLVISNANQRGKVHPTQKPVALMEYLIKTYTNEGDTVLDFCMGSGSTGVACVNLGRDFIGIEKDTEHGYFDIAQQRIDEAQQAQRLFTAAD